MIAQVYRNLNTGLWSVRQKVDGRWLVVAHCSAVVLRDVKVRQSQKERQRVLDRGVRSVHCWAYGELVHADIVTLKRPVALVGGGWDECSRGVTYNPFQHETLVYRDGGEYRGSRYALFNEAHKMEVSE